MVGDARYIANDDRLGKPVHHHNFVLAAFLARVPEPSRDAVDVEAELATGNEEAACDVDDHQAVETREATRSTDREASATSDAAETGKSR